MENYPQISYNTLVIGNGEYFVLEHNRGSIVKTSREMNEVLAFIRKNNGLTRDRLVASFQDKRFERAIKTVDSLINDGYFIKKHHSLPDFTQVRIHITDRCNMCCKYCFGTSGHNSISFATACAAVDLLDRNNTTEASKILFFGGEPLIEYELMKRIIAYGRGKKKQRDIAFSITTNGTLVTDEVIDYFADNEIGVLLSFDGLKHDDFRMTCDNNPTYRIVVNALERLQKKISDDYLAVAVTITHFNNDIVGTVKTLISLGVKQIKLNFELTNDSAYSLNGDDYIKIAEQVPSIMSLVDENRNIDISYFSLNINGDGSFFQPYYCPACHHELTVSTDGSVYPCSLFIGRKEYRLGNVNSQIPIDTTLYNKMKNSLDRNINKCKECSNRYLCGGSCLYDCLVLMGDINGINRNRCKLFKTVNKFKVEYYLSLAMKRKTGHIALH